jgi:predicted DNA-binding protein (MmcQ/YjbR family)
MKPPDLLHEVAEICLSLPEATREDANGHAMFAVRGKKFAYFLNDHHGDGIVSVCVKVTPGQGVALMGADDDRFYRPAYMGPRGWIGLRLDLGEVDWAEVRSLVTGSYRLQAPKRLSSLIDQPRD